MRALREKLRDRDMSVESLPWHLKYKDDSVSGQHVELQNSNIALYHVTQVHASLYSILLGLRCQLEKSEERADASHACEDLRSNSRKEYMAALENTNAGLLADTFGLTTKAETDRLTLQQELENEKGGKIVQKKTVTRLRATVKSTTTNIESLFSEKEILLKSLNDTEFI